MQARWGGHRAVTALNDRRNIVFDVEIVHARFTGHQMGANLVGAGFRQLSAEEGVHVGDRNPAVFLNRNLVEVHIEGIIHRVPRSLVQQRLAQDLPEAVLDHG